MSRETNYILDHDDGFVGLSVQTPHQQSAIQKSVEALKAIAQNPIAHDGDNITFFKSDVLSGDNVSEKKPAELAAEYLERALRRAGSAKSSDASKPETLKSLMSHSNTPQPT